MDGRKKNSMENSPQIVLIFLFHVVVVSIVLCVFPWIEQHSIPIERCWCYWWLHDYDDNDNDDDDDDAVAGWFAEYTGIPIIF